LLIEKLTNFC